MAAASGKMLLCSLVTIVLMEFMGAFAFTQASLYGQEMCGFVDYALVTSSFNRFIAKTQKHCFDLCLDHPNCKSTNYMLETRQCGLNNASHLDGSQELKRVSGTFYAFNQSTVDCSIATPEVDVTKSSCKQLLEAGHVGSGIYTISPAGLSRALRVFCDMETDGGGWIVIQRRQDGSVDFYRNWADYQAGFGDLSGEFWIGNGILRNLTEKGTWQLRVDLEDWDNVTIYAQYENFQISGDNYRLTVDSYNDSSTAGDALITNHNGKLFSTKDNDNDNDPIESCAIKSRGGWWYDWCYQANLNSQYYAHRTTEYDSIKWLMWKRPYSLKKCSMEIRPNEYRDDMRVSKPSTQ